MPAGWEKGFADAGRAYRHKGSMSQHSLNAQRLQFLLDRARQVLSPRRVMHTLGVTHLAMMLASLHGLKIVDAALAGLLHDQSKEIKPKRMLAELERAGCGLPAEDLAFPSTWHGYHAAWAARTELGIGQPAVLEAVALHTTADTGIGPLAKVMFIADLCEPTRVIKATREILRAARADLDEGFRLALVHKARHVIHQKNATLHPKAVRALRAYANLEPEELIADSAPRAGHKDF